MVVLGGIIGYGSSGILIGHGSHVVAEKHFGSQLVAKAIGILNSDLELMVAQMQ